MAEVDRLYEKYKGKSSLRAEYSDGYFDLEPFEGKEDPLAFFGDGSMPENEGGSIGDPNGIELEVTTMSLGIDEDFEMCFYVQLYRTLLNEDGVECMMKSTVYELKEKNFKSDLDFFSIVDDFLEKVKEKKVSDIFETLAEYFVIIEDCNWTEDLDLC